MLIIKTNNFYGFIFLIKKLRKVSIKLKIFIVNYLNSS